MNKLSFAYTTILFVLTWIMISRVTDRMNLVQKDNIAYKQQFLGVVKVLDNNIQVLKKRIDNLVQSNGI